MLPGLVDVHVHFREPGLEYKEDFYTGSLAAAVGGVTTVLDMPNTDPPVSTGERLLHKRTLAEGKSHVDFGLFGVILQDNVEELNGLYENGAIGFKLFMGETTGGNQCPDDGAIFAAFRRAADLGVVVGVHAENNPVLQLLKRELKQSGRRDSIAHLESRPPFVEAEAVARAISLSEAAGNRLHIHHLSTIEGEELASRAKRRGVPVTCESLIAHLLLDDSAYELYGNLIQLNPPIRAREHLDHLWRSIDANRIDCVATDHAPHSQAEQKRENVWDGVGGFIGVETLLPLLLNCVAEGSLSLEKMVQLASENPARIYGLYPKKGSLAVEADADIALVDLSAPHQLSNSLLHSKHAISPYDGWVCRGRPVATYLRGVLKIRDGETLTAPSGLMLSPGQRGMNSNDA